ncbi:MAG: hypothetical protein E7401_00995 [Ruminococcaceae bacterium]|nr:hypothetical protein [Oscillospiraceae bacterium]
MKSINILRSTAALTLSGILAKTIDFVFRAYYSQRLGSEGLGIFSLVFSVHSIMLNIATGGLGVAVSKIVSEQYAARHTGDIRKTMRIALFAVLILSLAVIGVTFIFSQQISVYFLKEPRCRTSIVYLSPSILFMGISYCIKGYFYASRKIFFPASSEFLEQAVKITVIRFLLNKMLPSGIEHGCEAVFLGISIGELSSCLYLTVVYLWDCRNLTGIPTERRIIPAIFKVSLPVMTTSIAGSFLRMQEEVLTVSALRQSGLTQAAALSQYGNIYGMIIPLIVFPLTLLSSCFTLLVPEISRANTMKCTVRLKTLVGRIYRFAAFFGFLIAAILFSFADNLSVLVYRNFEIASPLRAICILTPVMFMDTVSCRILNGIGKQGALLFYSISDSVIRIILILALIPKHGINALIAVIFVSNIFTAAKTVRKVTKETKLHFELSGWLFRHITSAAVTCFVAGCFFTTLSPSANTTPVVCAILFSAVLYFTTGYAISPTSREDFSWLVRRMFFNA